MKDKFFNVLQLIGGIILSVGYIPQIVQIMQTHLVRDLNLAFNIMVFVGVLLMEIYALYLVIDKKTGHMFLVTNTASTILSGTMAFLILLYR